jgi:hypothetical protein
MKVCKSCGIEFHACSSCDLNTFWEYEFCSRKCWEKSEEYINNKYLLQKFYIFLNEKQRGLFKEILGLNCDYELEIEDWMKVIDSHQDQVNKGKWNG